VSYFTFSSPAFSSKRAARGERQPPCSTDRAGRSSCLDLAESDAGDRVGGTAEMTRETQCPRPVHVSRPGAGACVLFLLRRRPCQQGVRGWGRAILAAKQHAVLRGVPRFQGHDSRRHEISLEAPETARREPSAISSAPTAGSRPPLRSVLGSWPIFVKPLLRKNLARARCHSGVGWTSSSRGFSRLSSRSTSSPKKARAGQPGGGELGGPPAARDGLRSPSLPPPHQPLLCGPLRVGTKERAPARVTGTLLACSRLARQVALLKATAQCEWSGHDGEPRVQADRGSLIAGNIDPVPAIRSPRGRRGWRLAITGERPCNREPPCSVNMHIPVESHTVHNGMPMPQRFRLHGLQVDVIETLDQWHGGDHRYVKIKGDNGGLYILRFDETRAMWELTMFASERSRTLSAQWHGRGHGARTRTR
jgi:hypothetical protein